MNRRATILIFLEMITVKDPSLFAERKMEIIVFGMEAYIPNAFSSPKTHKPWLNLACSRAIHDKEVVHKYYLSLPSPDTHALYVSTRNYAKSVLHLDKKIIINKICQHLFSSNSPCDFWHLAKNIFHNFSSSSFPPLLHPDGTLLSPLPLRQRIRRSNVC